MRTNQNHIKALRDELARRNLAGFVVPLTDEHMSEYVGAYAERLKWLSGFDGSAGAAVVLRDQAAMFTDGRYTLQVRDQVDASLFSFETLETPVLLNWIAERLKPGDRIGFDPELATRGWVSEARKALAAKDGMLIATETNPIDAVWADRPEAPMALARPHGDTLSGENATAKHARIAQALQKAGADVAVVTMLDSIAWAFNMRGDDVTHTPVVHAFALFYADEQAELFVHERKVSDALRGHLGNRVTVQPREAFYERLNALAASGARIMADPKTNNAKVFDILDTGGASVVEGDDPCILMKAVKNRVEADGARSAHLRDGAAVSDFLAWFEAEAPKGTLDEMKAVAALKACRERHGDVLDQSFDTISGSGPNGAVIHYRVSAETNRAITTGDMYLVDSGAQYADGTTDITRTTIVGTPTDEMIERYTLVLKGHIALSETVFPAGTSGHALDAVARRPLWERGLDYAHGTGHGVGSYLAVHEGPQRIAKFGSDIALEPGMILSNEPGYYKPGAYGIRIENLILVVPVNKGGEIPMYGFETLTLAPLERKLIDPALLDEREQAWVDAYHARVYAALIDRVSEETRDWLSAMTRPLDEARAAA